MATNEPLLTTGLVLTPPSLLWCSVYHCAGLPVGAVPALQSLLNAQPPGAAVLHADGDLLPGVSQPVGLPEVPVALCLQELCAAKLQDHGHCMLHFFVLF